LLAKHAEKAMNFVPGAKFRKWILLELGFDQMCRLDGEDSGLCLREVTPSSLDRLAGVNAQLNTARLHKRLEAGNRCFLAEMRGHPLAYLWLFRNDGTKAQQLNACTDMQVDLIIPPKWAYLWDVWTEPRFRGRGIQPNATRILCGRLIGEGCRGLVTLVNAANRSSLRAFARNGFSRRAALFHIRLLGRDLLLSRYEVSEERRT
jgi:ribosomal protein S18 acetylase RimI-like enzyme